MGALADFLANVTTFDNSNQATATDRSVKRYFEWLTEVQGDPDYPAGYTAVDSVQTQGVFAPVVSGGTFRLACDLQGPGAFLTDAIVYNASAAQIETAIDASISPADEQQDLAVYGGTVTSGTFTLEFTLASGETFTTAAIVYNAVAGAVITAIDLAATLAGVQGWTNGDINVTGGDLTTTPFSFTYSGASVTETSPSLVVIAGTLVGGTAGAVTRVVTGHALRVEGWSDGDISVSGGDLTTTPVVYTFDGTSVAGTAPELIIVDGTSLTGGGSATPVVMTTPGQGNRWSWAVLTFINAVEAPLPVQGTILPLNVIGLRGSMHLSPNADVLRALAGQAAIDDWHSPVKEAILDGLRDNGVEV